MAFMAPRIDVSGKVIGALTIWQPVDWIWISLAGEEVELYKKMLEHPRLKSPAEIVSYMNDENTLNSGILHDSVENLLLTEKPPWWERQTDKQKEDFLGSGESVLYKVREDAAQWPVIAVHTMDLYIMMLTEFWEPRFMDAATPWEEVLEEAH